MLDIFKTFSAFVLAGVAMGKSAGNPDLSMPAEPADRAPSRSVGDTSLRVRRAGDGKVTIPTGRLTDREAMQRLGRIIDHCNTAIQRVGGLHEQARNEFVDTAAVLAEIRADLGLPPLPDETQLHAADAGYSISPTAKAA